MIDWEEYLKVEGKFTDIEIRTLINALWKAKSDDKYLIRKLEKMQKEAYEKYLVYEDAHCEQYEEGEEDGE